MKEFEIRIYFKARRFFFCLVQKDNDKFNYRIFNKTPNGSGTLIEEDKGYPNRYQAKDVAMHRMVELYQKNLSALKEIKIA